MVWIVLTASIDSLPATWGLVLIDEVEVHVVDHGLLFAHVAGAGSLNGSETTATDLMVDGVGVVHRLRDGVQLLLPCASLSLTRRHLLAHLIIVTAGAVTSHVVVGCSISASDMAHVGRREEGATRTSLTFSSNSFILGAIESVVLGVVSSSRSRRDSGHMG